MMEGDSMENKINDLAAGDPRAQGGVKSNVRRKLLRGGLGAGPVLMTLASRSVLAGTQCQTPSGFASMPTSRHGTQYNCIGRTPGFWKQEQKFPEWPSPPYFP